MHKKESVICINGRFCCGYLTFSEKYNIKKELCFKKIKFLL